MPVGEGGWVAENICAEVPHRQFVPQCATVGRFPEPGDEELLAGPSRNFQIFDPLSRDRGMAEVTQHIPDPGGHLVRYYGWYSNSPAPRLRRAGKTRGQRA